MRRVALPATFDAGQFQQLRLRKSGARLAVYWEAQPVAELAVPEGPGRVGLWAGDAAASFDMVRVTGLQLAADER